MTDQHRATTEQWAHHRAWAASDDDSSCILELRARVQALEAAQLEQAESHNRFCTDAIVRRVEALEGFDHRPLLAAVRAQSKAVAHFGNRLDALEAMQHAHADVSRLSDAEREQATQELAKPAAWRPLETEITCSTEAAIATAQQILRAPIVVEGTFEHGGETYRFKAKPERESAMTELRAASADLNSSAGLTSSPGGLVERVACAMGPQSQAAMDAGELPHGAARAAIREVAKWLKEQPGMLLPSCGSVLEQEADRG